MIVTVFSTNKCMRCRMVTRWLSEHNIKFTETKVENDVEAKNKLQGLGFTSAPVIEVKSDNCLEYISGFDIKKLNELLGGK